MAGLSFEHGTGTSAQAHRAFKQQLNKVYTWYTGGFVVFVLALALFEQMGLSRQAIGLVFLFATVALYAGIGIMSQIGRASCRERV